jgi:hypothetical protein
MKSFIIAVAVALSLTACTNYGKKVKDGHVEVYYKEGITKEEAEKTARLLVDADKAANNNTTEKKSLQLTKSNDTVNFRMVIIEEKLKGITDETFLAMGNVLSDSIFNGRPVNVDLTDNKFATLRTVHYKKYDYAGDGEDEYGTKYSSGNIEVFAKEGIGAMLANDLAGFLDKEVHPANTISFQVNKNENNDFVVKMVSASDKADILTNDNLAEICTKLSNEVFSGGPLVFQVTDGKFHPLKSFAYPADLAQPGTPPGQ